MQSHCPSTTPKFALREGHDAIDSAFTGSSNQYDALQFRTGEFAGTTSDPVLEVTYSTPGSSIILQDLNYTYDAVGNITQIIDASSTGLQMNKRRISESIRMMRVGCRTSMHATTIRGGRCA